MALILTDLDGRYHGICNKVSADYRMIDILGSLFDVATSVFIRVLLLVLGECCRLRVDTQRCTLTLDRVVRDLSCGIEPEEGATLSYW